MSLSRAIALAIIVAPIPVYSSHASPFYVPVSSRMFVRFVTGEAAATTTFGIRAPGNVLLPLLSGLPNTPSRLEPVYAGQFSAGEFVDFYEFTSWSGVDQYAFSTGTDQASLEAFTDRDNSLGWYGNIDRQVGPWTWILHLDDARSTDDDDNDVLIEVRLDPFVVPEPGSASLLLVGIGALASLQFGRRIARRAWAVSHEDADLGRRCCGHGYCGKLDSDVNGARAQPRGACR